MFDPTIPIKIFTSYAHKDEPMRQELDTHLAMIRRHEAVDIWNDREIDAGEEWDAAIRKEFEEARYERDPLLVARMLVVGRQCLDDALRKFDTAQQKISDKVEASRTR